MALAFAQYLPHFAIDDLGRLKVAEAVAPPGAQPSDTHESDIVAEAEERGRRAAAEAAGAEIERVRAEDRAAFESRLAEERRQWVEETADRLAEGLASGLDGLRSVVVEGAARALAPFLGTLIRQRALGELSQTVAALLHDGGHVRVRIGGPEALLTALRGRLEPHARTIEYACADGPDVSVTMGNTIIETRIAAWTDLVAAALDGKSDG